MNILLTSGGTKVPIDDVRFISNFSTGNFGKRIVTAALLKGHRITHLHHVDAPTPFEFKVDLLHARGEDYASRLDEAHFFSKQYMSKYLEEKFDTYDDYSSQLEKICTNFSYDAIILCAAVSDYKTNTVDGKISSKNGFSIELIPTEKLISKIRGWQPNTKLVGFKLLSNVNDDTLIAAAKRSIEANNCDFVVANDLNITKQSNKRLLLVYPEKFEVITGNSTCLATRIIEALNA